MESHSWEEQKREFALNKQVNLARIVLLEGWFPFTLHTSSKVSSRFCIGTVTTQKKNYKTCVPMYLLQNVIVIIPRRNYYC
jgi:hypothetical protein